MIFIVIIMIITVSGGVMAVAEGNIQWSASHFRVLEQVVAASVCLTEYSWFGGATERTHVADTWISSKISGVIGMQF